MSLCSCAGYRIETLEPITPDEWKGGQEGYRFYQPAPYIIVKTTRAAKKPALADSGDKGGKADVRQPSVVREAKLIWLPDYSKPYRVCTWNFLAKADFAFHFTDGWQLTSISDKSDNTTVATSAMDALASAAKTLVKATADDAAPVELYRLVPGKKGGFTLEKVTADRTGGTNPEVR